MPSSRNQSRRQFLSLLPAALLGTIVTSRPANAATTLPCKPGDHPEPRPGVDASRVLTADDLANADAAPIYDKIREIPEVADGIRCYCGCAELPDYYSLLTCYEEGGMAQWCEICQGEAKLVHSLHERGNSLDQIRTAIDALYG